MTDFESSIQTFREKLENQHNFPSLYLFKFIVPSEQKEQVTKLLPKSKWIEKPSKNGKYISLGVKVEMHSSDAVIEIYKEAHKVKGIIAL